jgi:hypothetical protein
MLRDNFDVPQVLFAFMLCNIIKKINFLKKKKKKKK